MLEVREPSCLTRPNKPFWKDEDGLYWSLCGYAQPGNQCQVTNPYNPFDILYAFYTWMWYRLPAQMVYIRRIRICKRYDHVESVQDFHTIKGIYHFHECLRCERGLGWYRPDGTRIPSDQSWCDEGHVINTVWIGGCCGECGVKLSDIS